MNLKPVQPELARFINEITDKCGDADTVKQVLTCLPSVKRKHLEILETITDTVPWFDSSSTNNGVVVKHVMQSPNLMPSYMHGIVVITVIKRSMKIIDAMIPLFKHRNATIAGALVRLQLDSLMRIHAFDLVDDGRELFRAMIKNRGINKIKSRDGKKLHETYLYNSLAEKYPNLDRIYKVHSGYIHLATPDIHTLLRGIRIDNLKAEWRFSMHPTWDSDDEIHTAGVGKALLICTAVLLFECLEWAKHAEGLG